MGSKIPGEYRPAKNTLIHLEKANRLVHFSNTGIQMWQGPEWKKIEIPNHESNSRPYDSGTFRRRVTLWRRDIGEESAFGRLRRWSSWEK